MTTIKERAGQGLPLKNELIIDCHCHMGHWFNFNVPQGTAEDMLSMMDTLGMDIACVTAHSSIGPDFKFGNDMVIDAVKKYPDRFIGYVTINPNYSEQEIRQELDRCFSIDGMKAIKVHPGMHGCPIDYRKYDSTYQRANELKCPVLIHVWGSEDVAAVVRLAGRFKDASFIMGHAGAEILAMGEALEAVNNFDNIYVDLAISRIYEGNVEWFVKEVGSKKVLFGSDMPFMDPRPTFGRLAFSDITEQEKQDIFGLNMKRLLRL